MKDNNAQQAKLAQEVYTIAIDFLNEITATYKGWMGANSKLVVLGGLMINVDGPQRDVFEPLMFTAVAKDGTTDDLMAQAFNKKTPVSWTPSLPAPVFEKPVSMDSEWIKTMPRKQKRTVNAHFTSALPGSQIEELVFRQISKLGITPENSVFAQSTCPDELNHDDYNEDITRLMRNRYGEVFPLGGLAGLPFTGKTGWGAFSHHVPKDGNIVVLYAPHVGITADGVVGKVHRPGQKKATSACGASVGAYNAINAAAGSRRLAATATDDRQLNYIIEALKPHVDKVKASGDKNAIMAALAYETYAMVEEMLNDITDLKWMDTNSKLVLLGGIMINMDGDAPDLFIPLNFDSINKAGVRTDLMADAFGEKAATFAGTAVTRSCTKGTELNASVNRCVACHPSSECSLSTKEQKKSLK